MDSFHTFRRVNKISRNPDKSPVCLLFHGYACNCPIKASSSKAQHDHFRKSSLHRGSLINDESGSLARYRYLTLTAFCLRLESSKDPELNGLRPSI